MYKVVIVDDEPIIVEGLSRLLPWEKYGCEVVGTAYNGNEGLEMIRKEKPDVLFSDIAMPGMDGLTMIAALKSEFPEMQISILTGYRDFDFCQRALRLGVVRFLLKPSNMEELEEALRTMTERCGRQEETAQTENASGFIVRNALAYMEEHYQEKLTLNKVADQIYVSQWHLSKLLNKQEGKNFSEILNQIRINKKGGRCVGERIPEYKIINMNRLKRSPVRNQQWMRFLTGVFSIETIRKSCAKLK